jgi:hypothetical protein
LAGILICIPFTSFKSGDQIVEAQKKLIQIETDVNRGLRNNREKSISVNLSRLLLMIKYASFDLKILQLITAGTASNEIENEVKQMITFLENNSTKGVFLISGKDNPARYLKHYASLK